MIPMFLKCEKAGIAFGLSVMSLVLFTLILNIVSALQTYWIFHLVQSMKYTIKRLNLLTDEWLCINNLKAAYVFYILKEHNILLHCWIDPLGRSPWECWCPLVNSWMFLFLLKAIVAQDLFVRCSGFLWWCFDILSFVRWHVIASDIRLTLEDFFEFNEAFQFLVLTLVTCSLNSDFE